MNNIKYAHANLISCDWRNLSNFYICVFGCVPVGSPRKLSGDSIAAGTGVCSPEIEGIHLRLPGYGSCGPTLEIFQYKKSIQAAEKQANTQGLTHLAFEVKNLESVCVDVIRWGGALLGRLSEVFVEEVGTCNFLYVRDPERNIIEIQSWEYL
ncbi:VOC family protein [Pseudomonas sp. KU43P]|uniref:VOC family protein n=1 Tax=Pseudomonas sp. KU43P TaxID=2487887 RepID=UPI0012A86A55|nr:VOC family protein [Pseudomonas sp. KU43P]BBH45429.1 hypothetical protein KU43P_19060 [Pseudomonas sp. KU43P]